LVRANDLWWDYVRHRHFFSQSSRWWIIVPALLFYLLGFVAIHILDDLHVPFRGHWSLYINFIVILGFTVPTFVLLLFWVVEETRLCIGWIRRLTQYESRWTTVANDHEAILNDWLDVRIIAERTEQVSKLVRYPFMVLFVILLSQSTLFDNWQRPAGLVLIIIVSAGYALYCSLALNREAHKARSIALKRMQDKLVELRHKQAKNREQRIAQMERLIQEVKEVRQGAFRPWHETPLFRAILWIFSTAGMLGYSAI
jgi:signal transduction histidine kinase